MGTNFDGTPGLTGDVTNVIVLDPDMPPNSVVPWDKAFDVKVTWKLDPLVTAQALSGGRFDVKVFAESVGLGFEGLIGSGFVIADGTTEQSLTVTVAAKTLDPDEAPNSGLYIIRSLVTYTSAAGLATTIAGFGSGPDILVRKP